jgi:hypothetical protein
MTEHQANVGTGPGVITPDGCAVECYALLPSMGEPEIIAAAVPPGASILELAAGPGAGAGAGAIRPTRRCPARARRTGRDGTSTEALHADQALEERTVVAQRVAQVLRVGVAAAVPGTAQGTFPFLDG